MSENKDETQDQSQDQSQSQDQDDSPDDGGLGISDDQLPDDLVPSDDNPLAEGLPDGKTADDVRADEGRAGSAEDN